MLRHSVAWTDPRVTVAAARPEGGEVLVLASAPDEAVSLLLAGAERVRVVVPEPGAAALLELVLAASARAPIELRQVLGIGAFGRRVFLYHAVRDRLSEPTRAWWDRREGTLRAGIVDQDLASRYVARVRRRLLPLAHGEPAVRRLFESDDVETTYDRRWDTPRWRAVVRALGSRRTARLLGAPDLPYGPLGAASPEAVAARTRRGFVAARPAENPYLQRLLLGTWESAWPEWIGDDALLALRAVAGRVLLERSAVEDALARADGLAAVLLGDAPGHRAPPARDALLSLARDAARPGGRIVWREPLAGRVPDEQLPDGLTWCEEEARALDATERSPLAGPLRIAARR